MMMQLFPEIEPYRSGMLDVGDGHELYWEECGNPDGKPAVVLHGGPGSGCSENARRAFDPSQYRIVLFDQRGAGRSRPRVDANTDLSTNTTSHLVADIERLREHLRIDRWLVKGGSWGVTLGLVYAEQHPERVTEMILLSVTMSRPADIHWLYHEVGRYFPEEWERFRMGVSPEQREGNLVAAYYELLNLQPDVGSRMRAAHDWCDWEAAVLSLEEGIQPQERYLDPDFRMTFARIVSHYFHNNAWLEDGEILTNAEKLHGIPGVLIHGRLDLGGPVDTAWQLARAWPDAELHMIRSGHAGNDEMTSLGLEAADRFVRRT